MDVANPACFAKLFQAADETIDDFDFPRSKPFEVDARFLVMNPPCFAVARFPEERGDMEERLGWNAPDVKTDSAGPSVRVDQSDPESFVGRVKRSRVTSRAGADDGDLASMCFFAHRVGNPFG